MVALAFYFFAAVTLTSGLLVVTARNPVHAVFFLILAFFSSAGLFVLLEAEFLAMILVVVYVGAVAVLFLFVVMMLDIPVPQIKPWFLPSAKALLSSLGWFGSYIAFYAVIFAIVASLSFMALLCLEFIIFPWLGMTFSFLAMTKGFLLWLALFVIAALAMTLYISTRLSNRLFRTSFIKTFKVLCHNFPVGFLISLLLGLELIFVIQIWNTSDFAKEMILSPVPSATIMSNTQALGQKLYTEYFFAFQASGLILLVAMIGAIVLTLRRREDVKRQNVSDQVNRTKADAVSLHKVKSGEGIPT